MIELITYQKAKLTIDRAEETLKKDINVMYHADLFRLQFIF